MSNASERLVNLALYLASTRAYVSAETCRTAGLGYPEGQDDVAFLRMFERDKDALRAAGLVIDVRKVDEVEAYRLDAAATFAREVTLEPAELATVRAVAAALTGDPGFPFGEDLSRALGKLGTAGETGPLAGGEFVTADAVSSAPAARALAAAIQARKIGTFSYTNQSGEVKHHTVEPYGVFFREGRWYLVGLDRELAEIRTYAVSRIQSLRIEPARPHTPDFEPPEGFDIRDYERLPFQYGEAPFAAELHFDADAAWRAPRLARGEGTIDVRADGSLTWTVEARSVSRLARWVVDEGPGIRATSPPELSDAIASGLRTVVTAHG